MHGEDLEAILVRLGLASERQLAAARAAQWGYPFLGRMALGSMLRQIFRRPCWMHARRCRCTASETAKRFLLGFVYRVEHSLLNSLEQITGFRVEPCFITATEFREQMRRLTTIRAVKRSSSTIRNSPVEMANIVAGFALELPPGKLTSHTAETMSGHDLRAKNGRSTCSFVSSARPKRKNEKFPHADGEHAAPSGKTIAAVADICARW